MRIVNFELLIVNCELWIVSIEGERGEGWDGRILIQRDQTTE